MHRRDDIEYLVSIISACQLKPESELLYEFNEQTIKIAENNGLIRNDGSGNYIATPRGHELANEYSKKINQQKTMNTVSKWINKNCRFAQMIPKFNPVDKSTEKETAKFIKNIFPDHDRQHDKIDRSLRRSVTPDDVRPGDENYDRLVDKNEYYRWTDPSDEKKMIGSSGLYRLKEHPKDEIWLDWFGVSDDQRGNGAGASILNQTIQKAKQIKNEDGSQKYKTIKLWTKITINDYNSIKTALKTGIWPDKNSVYRLTPEGAAQKIYHKAGFRLIGESNSNGMVELIWSKELV